MRLTALSVGILLLLPLRGPLAAQTGARGVFVGLGAGPAAIPSAYSDGCGRLMDSPPIGGSSGSLHAGARLTPTLAAEARIGYARMPEQACLAIAETHGDGVHTDRYRGSGHALRYATSDFRLRYEPYAPWVFAGGVGWQWAHGDPYLVGSLGWSVGRRLRGMLSAEFTGHRIGVREVTREWRGSRVVRTISEEEEDVWRMGAALRVGVELDVR